PSTAWSASATRSTSAISARPTPVPRPACRTATRPTCTTPGCSGSVSRRAVPTGSPSGATASPAHVHDARVLGVGEQARRADRLAVGRDRQHVGGRGELVEAVVLLLERHALLADEHLLADAQRRGHVLLVGHPADRRLLCHASYRATALSGAASPARAAGPRGSRW